MPDPVSGWSDNPLERFDRWFGEAVEAGLDEPSAAALATADVGARPSARMVLLKSVDRGRFRFATNFDSRKARELKANPYGCLMFYWHPLNRQVRIEGPVQPAASDESDRIFNARPRGAQLGAWASPQSRVLADGGELERRLAEMEQRFTDTVPRPDFWGAYELIAERLEFWQGRVDRLHDRQLYSREPDGSWRLELLAP